MIDWVAIWLAGKAAAFVFRPVLEELAKEASRDWIKNNRDGPYFIYFIFDIYPSNK